MTALASRHTPKYRVKVEGKPLPVPAVAAMRELVVDQAVDMADMFILTLENEGGRFSDNELFLPGSKIEVELGYQEHGGKTAKVIEGEVVTVRANYPRRGPMSIRVQGMTKHHRLQRGRFIRQFKNMTFSEIVTEIAGEVELKPDAVEKTDLKYEYVFQHNQTNLEFILELAEKIGYEVFATDGRLFFRKPPVDKTKVRVLKKGVSLLSFNPRIHAALMPTDTLVRGWDPEEKAAFAGTAKESDVPAGMGGKTSATDIAKKLGVATYPVYEQVLAKYPTKKDEKAATAYAKAILTRAALNLVRADATVPGSPDLRPGFVVEIQDVGPIFSGQYYITRVIHNYLPQGFATKLELRRTSIEVPPQPVKPPVPVTPKPPVPPLIPLLKLLLAKLPLFLPFVLGFPGFPPFMGIPVLLALLKHLKPKPPEDDEDKPELLDLRFGPKPKEEEEGGSDESAQDAEEAEPPDLDELKFGPKGPDAGTGQNAGGPAQGGGQPQVNGLGLEFEA